MENREIHDAEQECTLYALKTAGLRGTASVLSILKLREDEERLKNSCMKELKERGTLKN